MENIHPGLKTISTRKSSGRRARLRVVRCIQSRQQRQPQAMKIAALVGWTSEQRSVVIASFLGWTLDAFDFFLLVFVIRDIAGEFKVDISAVTFAILLTCGFR
jgi:hypothetical protein